MPWPTSRSPPASAACAASTRPSGASTAARRQRCAASGRAARRARRDRHHAHAQLRAALRLASDARVPRGARDRRRRAASSRDRYARTIEIDGATARSRSRRSAPHALAATIRFPDVARAARDRRAHPPRSSISAPTSRRSTRSSPSDPLPRAARRRAARPARAGRLGRLRARGARRARPADHASTAARRLAAQLVARIGEPLRVRSGDARSHARLPAPARLAGADLRARHAARARAALAALAARRRATRGSSSPRRSRRRVARLRALPGIGEWTAQYIALRALREPDAFPAADIGLLRALAVAATARGRRRPRCSRAPSAGVRGAPTPRSISGASDARRPMHAPSRRRISRMTIRDTDRPTFRAAARGPATAACSRTPGTPAARGSSRRPAPPRSRRRARGWRGRAAIPTATRCRRALLAARSPRSRAWCRVPSQRRRRGRLLGAIRGAVGETIAARARRGRGRHQPRGRLAMRRICSARRSSASRSAAARAGVDLFVNAQDRRLPARPRSRAGAARGDDSRAAAAIATPVRTALRALKRRAGDRADRAAAALPLNVLAGPACPPSRSCSALGVRRVSAGSGIAQAAARRTTGAPARSSASSPTARRWFRPGGPERADARLARPYWWIAGASGTEQPALLRRQAAATRRPATCRRRRDRRSRSQKHISSVVSGPKRHVLVGQCCATSTSREACAPCRAGCRPRARPDDGCSQSWLSTSSLARRAIGRRRARCWRRCRGGAGAWPDG